MTSRICTVFLVLSLTTSCNAHKIIYIASTLNNCKDSASQKCLQVKENKEDEWTLLPNNIEGFQHKEGYLQKIEVAIRKVKNPSADESLPNYKLVKLIYEEKDALQVPFNLVINQNDPVKWQIKTMIGMDSLTKQPTLIFKDGQVSGNAGCNNYGATFTLHGNEITFGLTHATKMFCTHMQLEKTFFNCLSQVKTYKLLDDKLTFYDTNNVELMVCSSIE